MKKESVFDDLFLFDNKNRWVVPLFYLLCFCFFFVVCEGYYHLAEKTRLIKGPTCNVVNCCFTIIAITTAEVICWRTYFSHFYKKGITNEQKDSINESAGRHLASWVGWHGLTILIVSVIIIYFNLLGSNNVDLLIVSDTLFVSLVLYWVVFVALLFFFSWQKIVEKNFKDYADFQEQFLSFEKKTDELDQLILSVSKKIKTKDKIRFLEESHIFSKTEIRDYKQLIHYLNRVKKTGYKKGIISKTDTVDKLQIKIKSYTKEKDLLEKKHQS